MTRPIEDLDVPLTRLQTDMHDLVVRQRLAALEQTRQTLPLLDPDRHALDLDADQAFAQLACDCDDPCACNGDDA